MNTVLMKDETLRLQAIQQYEILDTPPDPALDDIARLAAHLCGTPVAAISIITEDRVWFKSRIGISIREIPRTHSPCDATIQGDDVYEIPDALKLPEYSPLGIDFGATHERFYAGAPLTTPDGVSIGSLCVLDSVPRKLTDAQLDGLRTLARQVVARLELTSRERYIERSSRVRQRVESALTVERNFVSAVLDTIGALVVVFDTAGRVVRFNRACETISGYAFTELVGRPYWEKLIPKTEVDEAITNFDRIRSGGSPTEFENQWLSRSGALRRISWSATALLDAQGEVAFIIATGLDVTQQRQAETTLRESEARYRELVESSLGMVFTHTLDGTLLSMNTYGAESLGYTVDKVVGRSLSDLLEKKALPAFATYLEQLRTSGEAQGLFELVPRQGDLRVIAYRNKLIKVDGQDTYVLAHGIDITEKVRAEEQLRNLMRQSDSILESVGDGIYGIDLNGNTTVINPAAEQMLGYKPDELLGKNIHAVIHHTRADGTPYPESECPTHISLQKLESVRTSNDVFWRKDGTSFPVEYVANPQIEDGKAIGVVVAFTDTTERRALDRMKDEFVSTVSHELRTPLTSLRAALGLVVGGALNARPEKMKHMLEIAIGNTDRLVRLVNDILDLERIGSGKAELHSTMCNMDDLLQRAAALQQSTAAKVNIRFRFEANSVNVWADPDRTLQTLTNLISNAIKFSPPDSEIFLAARYVDESEAIIQVSDHGRGIPEDKLEAIFERFQQVDASDSRTMGGTGLGLAICRSIVQQHGGRIWAESAPGHGATIYFTLPTKPSTNLR